MPLDPTTTSLLLALAIVIAGFIIAKLGSSFILYWSKKKDVIKVKHIRLVKIFRYLIFILTMIIALFYLRVDLAKDVNIITNFLSNTYSFLPTILLVVLLIVLAVAIVNLVTLGLRRMFDVSGITEFMVEQKKEHFLHGILIFVRITLYFFTALFLLNLFGINVSGITNVVGWIFYALAALFFLYVFFGTRTFMENFVAGI
jgi:hypothetical protein